MQPRSPLRIALVTAVLTSVAVGLSLYLLAEAEDMDVSARTIGVVMLVSFFIPLGITFLVVKRYVQDRVDLLHRTVHEARRGRSKGTHIAGDDIGDVSNEVSAWAEGKYPEIKELRERERYRREFIGNLAHELRTPIFNIQGYILTLLEGGLEDPKVNRDFLQRADKGVERMIRIVEDLGLISAMESGVLDMRIDRMDLNIPVDTVIGDLRKKAAERGFSLINGIDGETWVMADMDRLEQVFGNILLNAINYGREGGTCTIRAFDTGEQVLVEAADDGPGIMPEHLPRLFERFYRVGSSRARNEGGSGLGLAIAKHIVESHGGTITAKSTQGKGTTFSFTLPKVR